MQISIYIDFWDRAENTQTYLLSFCFPISITHLCFLSFLELTGGWIDMKKAFRYTCASPGRFLIGKRRKREGVAIPKNKINKIIESRRHPDLARSTLNSVIDEVGSWDPSLGDTLRVLLWWVGQLLFFRNIKCFYLCFKSLCDWEHWLFYFAFMANVIKKMC